MKRLAFVVALVIAAFGAVGFLVPSILVWLGLHATTPVVFCIVALIRIAFGLILILVAPNSRAPNAIRILGVVIVIAGIGTALTGLLNIEGARSMVEWWLHQPSGLVRLTGVVLAALGGFIAWALAPVRSLRASG